MSGEPLACRFDGALRGGAVIFTLLRDISKAAGTQRRLYHTLRRRAGLSGEPLAILLGSTLSLCLVFKARLWEITKTAGAGRVILSAGIRWPASAAVAQPVTFATVHYAALTARDVRHTSDEVLSGAAGTRAVAAGVGRAGHADTLEITLQQTAAFCSLVGDASCFNAAGPKTIRRINAGIGHTGHVGALPLATFSQALGLSLIGYTVGSEATGPTFYLAGIGHT